MGALLAAYSRLAVPCVPMYVRHGFTEGRDGSRHFSYRAIRQSDEVCQRYISRVSDQFPPPPPTITTLPPCAARSSSSLSYFSVGPPSHLPFPSATHRSAHSSFTVLLCQTVPQHRQVHSVSRQQCGLGASCPRSGGYPWAGTSSVGCITMPSWHGR